MGGAVTSCGDRWDWVSASAAVLPDEGTVVVFVRTPSRPPSSTPARNTLSAQNYYRAVLRRGPRRADSARWGGSQGFGPQAHDVPRLLSGQSRLAARVHRSARGDRIAERRSRGGEPLRLRARVTARRQR